MKTQLSHKQTRYVLVILWVLPVIVISLPLWLYMKLTLSPKLQICDVLWPNKESQMAYKIILNLFFYLLPLMLIVFYYLRIRVSLKESSGFHREMTTSVSTTASRRDQKKHLQRNAKALRVLTPVVIVFFITMLPFTAFRLALVFADMASFRYTRVLFFLGIVSVLANSSVNPLIYSIVSADFRRSFIHYLGFKKGHLQKKPTFLGSVRLSRAKSERVTILQS